MTGIATAKGGTTIQSLTYNRDAAGRITSITSPTAAEAWSYGYDALDQLVSATSSDGTLRQTFSYTANLALTRDKTNSARRQRRKCAD